MLILMFQKVRDMGLYSVDSNDTSIYRNIIVERKQEGWLSPTERASLSAISLMHNCTLFGYLTRVTPVMTDEFI